MKVAVVTSEAVPFAKTGGLADVTGSLFKEFTKAQADAYLIMPLYRTTVEHFKDAICPTGIQLDIPLGKTIQKCDIYTVRGDQRESKRQKEYPGSAGTPLSERVFFVSNNSFFYRDELYGTADGDYPDNDRRFIFFCRSVLELCKRMDLPLDILHCNDWQTGLIPLYLKTVYREDPVFKQTKSVFTIHNLGFQGIFPPATMELTGFGSHLFNPEGIEFYGKVNFLKAGIVGADHITTVSMTYAKEILTPEYGFGLDGLLRKRAAFLCGIPNGIDYVRWNPSTDTALPKTYSAANPSGKSECKRELMRRGIFKGTLRSPLLCYVGRLSSQKGVELLADIIPDILDAGAYCAIIGKGDEPLQERLTTLARQFPERLFLHIGFDESLARLIYAGSDMFIMPSLYEPCGIGQMIAMRYGTVPVARKTGGLSDTILDAGAHPEKYFCEGFFGKITETGFLFAEYTHESFFEEIKRALCIYRNRDIWSKIMKNGMLRDFSWKKSAVKYLELYSGG